MDLLNHLELWLNLSATKLQNSQRRPKNYVKSGTLCGSNKISEKINLKEEKIGGGAHGFIVSACVICRHSFWVIIRSLYIGEHVGEQLTQWKERMGEC